MGSVVIKRGKAKPLWKGHPWVFRESIARAQGDPRSGDVVQVLDEAGKTIGCGFFSAVSRIGVRMLGTEPDLDANAAFFRKRLVQAIELREKTLALPVVTDACRLVHSEGDRLPGLVVDRFADHLVVQFSTAGLTRHRKLILDLLEELLAPSSIHEVVDKKACRLERIKAHPGLARGRAPGEPPSILENGVRFRIGLGAGQKTGFFTDQRDNRQLLGRYVRDRTVLDLHTYTGGFGLYAAANGAEHVLGIDSSGPALALAAENAMLNNGRQVRFERGEARAVLDFLHRTHRRFDVVISDPPRLAPDRSAVARALRAYRDLHLRALRVVERGGLFAASCCSGAIEREAFECTLKEAAHDLGRTLQILHRGGQAPDHPILATSPGSDYLKFVLTCVT